MGFVHGSAVLPVAMPLLPYAHHRRASECHGPIPGRQLELPGFLAQNYRNWTAVVTFLGRLVYGIILGAFYQLG